MEDISEFTFEKKKTFALQVDGVDDDNRRNHQSTERAILSLLAFYSELVLGDLLTK